MLLSGQVYESNPTNASPIAMPEDVGNATLSARRIPNDIVAIILDQVRDWTYVTSCCSLVCREWLPMARRHLFRTVKVTLRDNARLVSDFLALLDSSPTIRPSIENLTLQYSPRLTDPKRRLALDGLSLLLLLSELPNLQVLTLQGIKLDGTQELGEALLNRKFSLRSLYLHDIICSDAPHHGDVTNILSLFSRIGSLVLEGIIPNFQPYGTLSQAVRAPYDLQVEGIELPGTQHGVGTTVWLSLLVPSLRFLTSITMFCHNFRDITCFSSTLSQASATLRSICLRLADGEGGGLTLEGLGVPHRADVNNTLRNGFRACSQIESLELHGFVTVDKPEEDWTMLTSIISHAPPTLKHLTFEVYFEDTNWGDQAFHGSFTSGWELLRVLCSRFTCMQSFSFEGGSYQLELKDSNCKEICLAMEEYRADEAEFYPPYYLPPNDALIWRPSNLTRRWMAHMPWEEKRKHLETREPWDSPLCASYVSETDASDHEDVSD